MSSVFPKAWETTIGATIAGCSWIKGKLSVSFRTVQELQENPEEEVQPGVVINMQESTTAASSTTTTAPAAAATSTTLISTITSVNKKINAAIFTISLGWLIKSIPDKTWVFYVIQVVLLVLCIMVKIFQDTHRDGLRVLLVQLWFNLMLLGGEIVVIISSY